MGYFDHYLISDLILAVYLRFLSMFVIFIYYSLLLMMYDIPIGYMISWKYYILVKHQLYSNLLFYSMVGREN